MLHNYAGEVLKIEITILILNSFFHPCSVSVKMNTVAELSDSGLLQASYALKFIQRQLVELSMDCETTIQRELIRPQFFIKLQNKLLHEVGVSISTMFLFSKLILRNTLSALFIVNTLLYLVDSFITEILSLLFV